MFSLTGREFDAVSSALLEALADAKRREPAPGARPRNPLPRRDPMAASPVLHAMRLVGGR
jgi:hypothetical protein